MDYDTYSAHDPIGQVYIRLSNLVQGGASNSLEGWFPIYDTLHGIRGSLRVKVQVQLFSDQHFFRTSSCGMMFFTSESLVQVRTLQSFIFWPRGCYMYSIHSIQYVTVVS